MDVYQQEGVMDFQRFVLSHGADASILFLLNIYKFLNSLLPLKCYHLSPDRPEENIAIGLGQRSKMYKTLSLFYE